MPLDKSNGPRKGQPIANQFRTGVEWQPGRPSPRPSRKNEVVQPVEAIKSKVGVVLLDYFKREQPPAQDIVILPGSLRLVDVTHDTWIASVQTTIYWSVIAPRHHISRVRFRILRVKQGEITYSIHHNHIIFI